MSRKSAKCRFHNLAGAAAAEDAAEELAAADEVAAAAELAAAEELSTPDEVAAAEELAAAEALSATDEAAEELAAWAFFRCDLFFLFFVFFFVAGASTSMPGSRHGSATVSASDASGEPGAVGGKASASGSGTPWAASHAFMFMPATAKKSG